MCRWVDFKPFEGRQVFIAKQAKLPIMFIVKAVEMV